MLTRSLHIDDISHFFLLDVIIFLRMEPPPPACVISLTKETTVDMASLKGIEPFMRAIREIEHAGVEMLPDFIDFLVSRPFDHLFVSFEYPYFVRALELWVNSPYIMGAVKTVGQTIVGLLRAPKPPGCEAISDMLYVSILIIALCRTTALSVLFPDSTLSVVDGDTCTIDTDRYQPPSKKASIIRCVFNSFVADTPPAPIPYNAQRVDANSTYTAKAAAIVLLAMHAHRTSQMHFRINPYIPWLCGVNGEKRKLLDCAIVCESLVHEQINQAIPVSEAMLVTEVACAIEDTPALHSTLLTLMSSMPSTQEHCNALKILTQKISDALASELDTLSEPTDLGKNGATLAIWKKDTKTLKRLNHIGVMISKRNRRIHTPDLLRLRAHLQQVRLGF